MVNQYKENLSVKSKIWFEINGKPLIGDGRLKMLESINKHGSIIKASEEIEVSYRKTRGAIRDMEASLGERLVKTRRGGTEGGGASLTDLANELIQKFKAQQKGVNEMVNAIHNKIFFK